METLQFFQLLRLHLTLLCCWPVPRAGLGTEGSATSSRRLWGAGIRLKLGAPSSGPPWLCSRTGKWYVHHWVGLRRWGQKLQWVDHSNFNSSVKMKRNAECVRLAENHLKSGNCSDPLPYICSRPQTQL